MLGSHFDLDREIAQIASNRDAKERKSKPRETRSERSRAYSDFYRSLKDFVRALGDDTGASHRDAEAGAAISRTHVSKKIAKPDPAANVTVSSLAVVRKVAGDLGQIR